MVLASGSVCNQKLLAALKEMRGNEEVVDIEHIFEATGGSAGPTTVTLRVSFLSDCDLMMNACGCPRAEGGLYQVGHFLEVCSNTVVCYRIERIVDGDSCKLPQELANILCVSLAHRAQILQECSQVYYASQESSQKVG